jgi:hypothetical protein
VELAVRSLEHFKCFDISTSFNLPMTAGTKRKVTAHQTPTWVWKPTASTTTLSARCYSFENSIERDACRGAYVATDSAGLTSTSTQTVIIQAANDNQASTTSANDNTPPLAATTTPQ